MNDNYINKVLGLGWREKILKFLSSEMVIDHGYSPTWWIALKFGSGGKDYCVRSGLNILRVDGFVEVFKHHSLPVGDCWKLTKINNKVESSDG